MKPAISVLLPSRGRPVDLKSSVESIFDLAEDPDLDDPHLREAQFVGQGVHEQRVLVIIGERWGYACIHDMFNQLASLSRGDWLVNWNDDARWVTHGWDELLRDAPLFAIQYPRQNTAKSSNYTVPVTSRQVYQAIGHLSQNAYSDAWSSDVSAYAGTSVIRDDVVYSHERPSDDTAQGQSLVGDAQWALFVSDEQRAMRRAESLRLVKHPVYVGRFDDWDVTRVDHPAPSVKLGDGEAKARSYVLRGRRGR